MAEPGQTESAAEARYKVGDVCRIADVQPYVLRYWESEFPVLAPDRSIPGPRTYTARELRIIERVKKLLYDEGYTIAGAKKRLDADIKAGTIFEAEPAELPAPAPDASPVPPSLPEAASPEPRARRVRVKPAAPEPFESEVSEPATPVVQPPDPRVARVVAELKEILALLSRDEP